jgi:hypothetical protein
MKKVRLIFKACFCFLFLFSAETGFAQNVGISSSASFTPDASAGLDVNFTNKGLLVPRVALTASNVAGPISSPTASLLVYNTATAGTSPNNVIPGYYYWNGTAWVMLSTTAQTNANWSLTGNAGITPGTNFLGTTDLNSVRFKTNKVSRLLVDSLGSVAVGNAPIFSNTAREKFLVDGGSVNYPTPAGAFNVISGKGYLDNYLQLNIQNTSPTGAASSDIVASNDAATETANFVDLGINSSANISTGPTGGANTAYLFSAGNDFAIGNGTANKNLTFFTSGTTVTSPQTYTERMRIDPTGNVGINNILPTEKLDVTGNLKFSGALMPNNNAGTAGYFLQSAGSGAPPIWFNAGNLVTSQAWGLSGNSGTNYKTNFLGNIDNASLRFRTNNTQRAIIDSLGNVGIGSANFDPTNPDKLLVDAGTTNSSYLISAEGSINSFLQFNIQNLSSGTAASADIVATANNGNDAAGYIDMGINSSTYASTTGVAGITARANTAYIYSNAADLVIGNGASNRPLIFFTNSGTTSTTNTPNGTERMRIDGATGNVGIGTGTTTPAQKLDVVGSIRASTSVISQGSVYVDAATTNSGAVTPGVVFGGTNSGEGIASQRTTGNLNGLDFYTSFANRMAITNTGNVGIGTNTPAYKLSVAGVIAPTIDNTYSLGGSTTNRWTVVYATNGAISTSDRRLKTNIKPLNYGLKEVLALQPVSYNWKDKSQPQNKIGLIAQDVKKLVPEVVVGNEAKEKLGMNYAELIPVLINAIKEQQKEIDSLKKAVQKLQK